MTLTRFAPAPTGRLHLGHVASAIHVWGLARAHHSHVLLRIEDHDRERCRPEYERAILDDLDWLGFEPDVFPTSEFRAGACASRQSDRHHEYTRVAKHLEARGLIYGCTCSRQQIAEVSVPGPDGERPYPGTCRTRGIPLAGSVAWRLCIDEGDEHFTDLLGGPEVQNPARQCGDLVIRDRLGNWTYQFVASVDDFLQGIDLVVRGRDLLTSTGRQIRIARLAGRPEPAVFAHHPLVMKTPAQKLSKSDGDTGVSELRAAGWTAERVIGAAANATGIASRADLSAREAIELIATRERPGTSC